MILFGLLMLMLGAVFGWFIALLMVAASRESRKEEKRQNDEN